MAVVDPWKLGPSENVEGQQSGLTRQDFGDQRAKTAPRLGRTADPTSFTLATQVDQCDRRPSVNALNASTRDAASLATSRWL